METVPMIAVPLHWVMFAGGILLGWVTVFLGAWLFSKSKAKHK